MLTSGEAIVKVGEKSKRKLVPGVDKRTPRPTPKQRWKFHRGKCHSLLMICSCGRSVFWFGVSLMCQVAGHGSQHKNVLQ
eukprot:2443113-Amphidinium_carterae.1